MRNLYHGSRRLFAKPKLNELGLFWLTTDMAAAKRYADGGKLYLYEVKLSPNAKIADLNDRNDRVTKELARYIEDNRTHISTTFRNHKLSDWWMSFEFLEENPDAIDFLRKHADGVLVTDVADGYDHDSLALFRLGAITAFNLVQEWKAKVHAKYSVIATD